MRRIDQNRRMAWTHDRGAVAKFWEAVGPREPWSWKIEDDELARALSEVVGKTLTKRIIGIRDPTDQIWKPRHLLSPILRGNDRSKKVALASWIIHDWGQILSGKNVYGDWLDALGDFSEKRVFDFAEEIKGDRVSSWSKILSFADYVLYPIYDSRTAVSVNVAAKNTRCRTFLYMPAPRNTKLPKAVERLNSITQRRNIWAYKKWNYLAYLFLLRRLVRFRLVGSIIEAEATLFANAERLADDWLEKRDAPGKRPRVLRTSI